VLKHRFDYQQKEIQMLATMQEAVREYAEVVGRDNADRQWVLSPYDTWELNPFYRGEPQPHPECDDE
jgi:hypothetical protein